MKHMDDAIGNVKRRAPRALSELHPTLHEKVCVLVSEMGGRVVPWTGYRGEESQNRAWLHRKSNARFGSSPHNFKPALACDLVLSPLHVSVRESPTSPGWPDLWDSETPGSLEVWEEMHVRAIELGLERVKIERGDKLWLDRPHVQLPGWRRIAGLESDGD